jgi:hypothetical protein
MSQDKFGKTRLDRMAFWEHSGMGQDGYIFSKVQLEEALDRKNHAPRAREPHCYNMILIAMSCRQKPRQNWLLLY